MLSRLRRRGPDGQGFWSDHWGTAGVWLGHRRLAVIDPGPAGAQPMVSADGRWVLTYNGELYNQPELRRDLAARGIAFRTRCDTETLVEAVAAWGVEAALHRLNGMYALALWDRAERRLVLARDPVGIKPLAWGVVGGRLLFASDLSAITAHPAFTAALDPAMVGAFLQRACVPAPGAIWQGLYKLPPGGCLQFHPDRLDQPRPLDGPDLAGLIGRARSEPPSGPADPALAAEGLERVLADAVARQRVADVPLGAFLSGGTDSAAIVALARSGGGGRLSTFTIGFGGPLDERARAAAIARHLGTDHHEFLLDAAAARDLVPRLADIHDEPFADPSQIPTHLISACARRSLTVALSGDGGDELLAGYPRHAMVASLWSRFGRWPLPLRQGVARMVRRVPDGAWHRLQPLVPARLWRRSLAETAGLGAGLLAASDPMVFYRGIGDVWPAGGLGTAHPFHPAPLPPPPLGDLGDRMRWADLVGYLPDDILTKVDRASMAVSLEVRVPLLDLAVIRHVWSLPPSLTAPGRGKQLLRRILRRHLPPALVDGGKTGFSPPVGAWLRGGLADWAGDLLSSRSLSHRAGVNPDVLHRTWAEHRDGRADHGLRLWTAVMLLSWLDRQPKPVCHPDPLNPRRVGA